ncbi:hypothetical protein D3C87_1725630 [compost metagenome]
MFRQAIDRAKDKQAPARRRLQRDADASFKHQPDRRGKRLGRFKRLHGAGAYRGYVAIHHFLEHGGL